MVWSCKEAQVTVWIALGPAKVKDTPTIIFGKFLGSLIIFAY